METNKKLTEKQELLLMRHFDGESSFLESRRAKALLRSTPEAEALWLALDDAARGTVASIESVSQYVGEVDLWDRIESRIEQEERAEFFLGRRPIEVSESKPGQKFFDAFFAKGFASGFAGAAAAVFMALAILPGNLQMASTTSPESAAGNATPVVLRDMNTAQSGSLNMASASTGSRFVPASANTGSAAQDDGYVQPQIIENRPVEVDWMRSDGRVRMVNDPSESAPMFWVKRHRVKKKVRIYRSRDGKRVLVVEKAIPSDTLVPGR